MGPNVRTPGAGGRYELAEPLLALRGVLARALDRPELAVDVALEAARQARKAGDLPNAMSALHNIKRAAATCATTYVTQTGRRFRWALLCASMDSAFEITAGPQHRVACRADRRP